MPHFRRNTRRGRRTPLKRLSRFRRKRGMLQRRIRKIELMHENKILNVQQIFTPGSTGSIKYLNGIVIGSAETSRIGKKINPQHIQGNIILRKSAMNSLDDNLRIIFYVDRQFTGSNGASITDVLTDSTVGSIRNQKNNARFQILMDKKITLQRDGDGASTRWIQFFRKFPSKFMINFLATGSAQADGGLNSIFLLMLADEGSNVTTFDLNYRLTYKDG